MSNRSTIKADLKTQAGLETVRKGGGFARDFAGKLMQGVRGGTYGPYTATDAWRTANTRARDSIEEVLKSHGLVNGKDSTSTQIHYVSGKVEFKFLLITVEHCDIVHYWWVLC